MNTNPTTIAIELADEALDAVSGGEDKLGNFEIQDLMSTYLQPERRVVPGLAAGITSPRDLASGLPTGKR